MRAELANINHCAVPFLSRAVVNFSWYNNNTHYRNCMEYDWVIEMMMQIKCHTILLSRGFKTDVAFRHDTYSYVMGGAHRITAAGLLRGLGGTSHEMKQIQHTWNAYSEVYKKTITVTVIMESSCASVSHLPNIPCFTFISC